MTYVWSRVFDQLYLRRLGTSNAPGSNVMICRDPSCIHIHLAVLLVCDVCALYAMDWSAMTARDSITIYGNSRVLCVQYVLCGRADVYYTCGVVVYVHIWGRKR
jgi:hypothetical protein